MATIDLRKLTTGEMVLHFGGRPREIDAYTFSNSLLALSEAMQEISRQLNPDHRIEIIVDGLGEGSFRAKIKTGGKTLSSLFKGVSRDIIVSLLAAFIYDRYIDNDDLKIIVQDDSYIIESNNGDRIILPKDVYEARQRMADPARVQRQVARTFEVLEEDSSVTDFGIAATIDAKDTLGSIPRDQFARLASSSEDPIQDERRRFVDESARLVVLKAIFERGERRWQFVWNGIRISAPIKSQSFFDKLAAREYQFTQGDVLIVTLRIFQIKDEMSGVWINERYEVIAVHDLEHTPKQQPLFS